MQRHLWFIAKQNLPRSCFCFHLELNCRVTVVPGHPSREVVCYTHALAAASGATGSDSSYSIDTTR
jgi:hypothetical protein